MSKLNLARLREYKIVAPDVETTGLHWYRDKMFGVAVAAYDGKEVVRDYYDIREKPRVLEALAVELPRVPLVVNHNWKFDAHFLGENKIRVPADRVQCTSVRAALINEHEPSFSLDALGTKYLGRGKVDIWADLAGLFGGAATRAVQIKNLHRAPPALAAQYAAPDPELAILLWLWQEEQIKKQELEQIWSLERALTPVLVEIEEHGIRVDVERAERSVKLIDKKIGEAQRLLDKMVGKEVNVNSAPQMHALFKVDSVDKDFLVSRTNQGDEAAKLVWAVRKFRKARSFLTEHILAHQVRGWVYPNYNQTRGDNELGTGPGRLSIDDPAMQQIPIRDVDVAEIIRPCFLPDSPKHVWCRSDWEQFEYRWFAHYLEDPKITRMYEDDPETDFHQVVSDLTGIPRDPAYAGGPAAKRINLGLVFGMGPGKMAAEMRMDFTVDDRGYYHPGPKARELFDKYHGAVPGVKELLSRASSIARSRGYVKSVMGRHLRFPRGQFVHKAAGLVFQSTSADCMKQKMIELVALCKQHGAHYLLSVHDEHNTSVPKAEAKEFTAKKKQLLQTFDGVACPIKCDIPILSSVTTGPNWWEVSKK